jgi:hypothetical protein
MAVAVIGLVVSLWSGADAGAVHDAGLFTTVLDRNDDGSVGPVAIGFDINFFGLNGGNQATLFVNNNGNVTFTGALNTFTPFNLITTGTPMIAPFFADVDTRNLGSDVVRYGQSSIGGQSVFGVNWIGVGYFFQSATHLNSFQLIITNRSDTGPGNFDFEFNYDTITWETGTAASSGGDSDGLGGNSARAGWSNGSTDNFELAGSAINGALLDSNCDAGGSTGLICNSRNSDVLGQYIFSVRNGQVEEPPSEVPLPGTLILLGAGLLGLGTTAAVRRRSK